MGEKILSILLTWKDRRFLKGYNQGNWLLKGYNQLAIIILFIPMVFFKVEWNRFGFQTKSFLLCFPLGRSVIFQLEIAYTKERELVKNIVKLEPNTVTIVLEEF